MWSAVPMSGATGGSQSPPTIPTNVALNSPASANVIEVPRPVAVDSSHAPPTGLVTTQVSTP